MSKEEGLGGNRVGSVPAADDDDGYMGGKAYCAGTLSEWRWLLPCSAACRYTKRHCLDCAWNTRRACSSPLPLAPLTGRATDALLPSRTLPVQKGEQRRRPPPLSSACTSGSASATCRMRGSGSGQYRSHSTL